MWNTVIRGATHANCGDLVAADALFIGHAHADVVTWSALIAGHARRGHLLIVRQLFDETMRLFEEMRCAGERPDEVAMLSLVAACTVSGALDLGEKIHRALCEMFSVSVLIGNVLILGNEFGIKANVKLCGCMVDMLGQEGLLEEAFGFIVTMKVEPNAFVWRALLGACQLHGNVELRECVNRELLKMRQDASGDCVMLSNLYASGGVWIGVEKVRNMMDDGGVLKEVGCALLEDGNIGRLQVNMAFNQIFITLLDGSNRCLQFPSPIVSDGVLKRHLSSLTGIHASVQRLVTGSLNILDDTPLSASDSFFPSCTLLLRLRAGNGGFHDAVQKKTNDFDACYSVGEVSHEGGGGGSEADDLSGVTLAPSSLTFGGGGSSRAASPQAIRADSPQPVARSSRGRVLVLPARFHNATLIGPPKPASAGACGKLKQYVS